MKVALMIAVATLALVAFPTSPVLGQISVDSGDGNTVTIGPGGINVRSNNGNKANVYVGPGGISVQSKQPGTGSAEVRTTTGARRSTSVKRVTTTSGKGKAAASVTSKTSNASATTGASINLKAALAKLEMAAYGRVDETSPLVVRIEKLEMDNLGKQGSGTHIARVQVLAKSLGVDLNATAAGTATTTVTTRETIVDNGAGMSVQFAPPALMIADNHHEGTYNLNNSTVAIASNNCTLNLRGTCKQLSITGNHNVVQVERATIIHVAGNHNTVVWFNTPQPTIANLGNYNKISKAGP